MKKIIKVLMAAVFSSATMSSIIACTNPFIDPNVIRITVVTDGHPVNDKSFNESSYLGAQQFQKEFTDWSNPPDELKNKRVVVTPIMPLTIDENNFVQSYGQAVVMNSAVTIASGFVQNSALVRAQNKVLKGNSMRYVYVDGDTPNTSVPFENKNLAGLLYDAEQSGLMAAIAGAVWLIAHADEYGGFDDLKMSTYGGLNIPTVTSYMYGFLWGIELVNNSINNDQSSFRTSLREWVKKLNPNIDENATMPSIKFIDLENQFTGNFNQASASSKAINSSLVHEGADIIFPVAGPQTSDTLAALESKGNGKIIGVDTDQILQYGESANRFITSALKKITNSVSAALWWAMGYDETSEHNKLSTDDLDSIFKEDAPYRGGSQYIGIADNPAIHDIYDGISNDTDLADFLIKVSAGWQDVLKNGGNNLWAYGRNYNPFTL